MPLPPGVPASLPVSAAIGQSGSAHLVTRGPSDIRLVNLVRLLTELCAQGSMPRSDLARTTGLAVPTVNRLVSELSELGLVTEDAPVADENRLGRPPAGYRFREKAGVIAGIDVGNESTRLALASLSGRVLTVRIEPTADVGGELVNGIVTHIREMLRQIGLTPDRLAAIGVGIASAVDPETGVLHRPPYHLHWHGLPLADQLRRGFSCAVAVDQDDHLAALAERSSVGTVPGASSVVVIEIGKGIGVGMAVESRPVTGTQGRFGRIADWPVTAPLAVGPQDGTLGKCVVTDGLVAQYKDRGGQAAVKDGAALFSAARQGDAVAFAVITWAAAEIADVAQRLRVLCDPAAIVLGGGLTGGFDLIEREIKRRMRDEDVLLPSILGPYAPLTGALLAAQDSVTPWLHEQLVRT